MGEQELRRSTTSAPFIYRRLSKETDNPSNFANRVGLSVFPEQKLIIRTVGNCNLVTQGPLHFSGAGWSSTSEGTPGVRPFENLVCYRCFGPLSCCHRQTTGQIIRRKNKHTSGLKIQPETLMMTHSFVSARHDSDLL